MSLEPSILYINELSVLDLNCYRSVDEKERLTHKLRAQITLRDDKPIMSSSGSSSRSQFSKQTQMTNTTQDPTELRRCLSEIKTAGNTVRYHIDKDTQAQQSFDKYVGQRYEAFKKHLDEIDPSGRPDSEIYEKHRKMSEHQIYFDSASKWFGHWNTYGAKDKGSKIEPGDVRLRCSCTRQSTSSRSDQSKLLRHY